MVREVGWQGLGSITLDSLFILKSRIPVLRHTCLSFMFLWRIFPMFSFIHYRLCYIISISILLISIILFYRADVVCQFGLTHIFLKLDINYNHLYDFMEYISVSFVEKMSSFSGFVRFINHQRLKCWLWNWQL